MYIKQNPIIIPATFSFDVFINTLRQRQDGNCFADGSFKRIFMSEKVLISIKTSLKFVPKGSNKNKWALVHIMVLALKRQQAIIWTNGPFTDTSILYITQPQSVNCSGSAFYHTLYILWAKVCMQHNSRTLQWCHMRVMSSQSQATGPFV